MYDNTHWHVADLREEELALGSVPFTDTGSGVFVLNWAEMLKLIDHPERKLMFHCYRLICPGCVWFHLVDPSAVCVLMLGLNDAGDFCQKSRDLQSWISWLRKVKDHHTNWVLTGPPRWPWTRISQCDQIDQSDVNDHNLLTSCLHLMTSWSHDCSEVHVLGKRRQASFHTPTLQSRYHGYLQVTA